MTEQKRDLQKDLELCEKATPGPWNVLHGYNVSSPGKRGVANTAGYSSNKSAEDVFQQNENNAEFIAAAREGWPHAIRRAMAAEAEVAKLRDALYRVKAWAAHPDNRGQKTLKQQCEALDKLYEFVSAALGGESK